MAGELIRLNNKHISVDQMTMFVDRVLQCYISNMFGPLSPLIENYLREARFWHVATIERWRPEMHTFYLPCGECTITLEDVHLQLGLSVDGYARSDRDGMVTRHIPGADNDSTELERIRYARAYILEMIGGYLMPDLSRNLVQLRWLLKLVDFRAAGELSWGSAVLATLYKEMCGATRPNKAKIGGTVSLSIFTSSSRPPIYISTHNEVEPFDELCRNTYLSRRYTTSIRTIIGSRTIRAVIPDEFFQNPNVWHVKVPLVNYAIVEMHQSDRENRYDYIPTQEPIIVPKLACVAEYMPWFKIHGKPYLLSEEKRRRQIRAQRERRSPLNPRRRDDDTGPSTVPIQSSGPTVQRTTPTSHSLFRLCQGALLSTNLHHLTDSNTSAIGDANTVAIIILSRWFILPTTTTRSPTGRTTTLAGS
ncbi:hypothetical protein CXB51_020002 [Gossypium anomalum]|uniref:Aminotransferase-like plant mobile domain-containing protein n=1 Tax=Gossypium anomalum TaxID=47600 RepID=A0A8J5YB01_9ROSI|nr:hypothetical protein CXB51_020002 [Gossypium anomalum]